MTPLWREVVTSDRGIQSCEPWEVEILVSVIVRGRGLKVLPSRCYVVQTRELCREYAALATSFFIAPY